MQSVAITVCSIWIPVETRWVYEEARIGTAERPLFGGGSSKMSNRFGLMQIWGLLLFPIRFEQKTDMCCVRCCRNSQKRPPRVVGEATVHHIVCCVSGAPNHEPHSPEAQADILAHAQVCGWRFLSMSWRRMLRRCSSASATPRRCRKV